MQWGLTHVAVLALAILATSIATGCSRVTPVPPGSTPLAQAVAERELDTVAALLAGGAEADSCDERGETALMIAVATDQYRIANLLVDHGADVWFADTLGYTPAAFAHNSRLIVQSEEGRELTRFIDQLRLVGYPWPPPDRIQVQEMRRKGRWPPRR